MGFSRQEYWSGLPRPPPGDLPDPGIKPRSAALQADSLLGEASEVQSKVSGALTKITRHTKEQPVHEADQESTLTSGSAEKKAKQVLQLHSACVKS